MEKKVETKKRKVTTKKPTAEKETKKEVKKTPKKEVIRYSGLLNLTYHDTVQMIGVFKDLIRDYEDKLKELTSDDSINEALGGRKKNTEEITFAKTYIDGLKQQIKESESKLTTMAKSPKRLEIFDYIDKCKNISEDSTNKLATKMIKKLHEMFGKNGYICKDIKMKDYNVELYFNGRRVESFNVYYTAEYSDSPSDYKFFSITLNGDNIDAMCKHMDRNSKEFQLLSWAYKRDCKRRIEISNSTKYKYFGASQDFKNPEEYEIDSYKLYYDDVCIRDGVLEVNNLDSILWLCKLIGVTL